MAKLGMFIHLIVASLIVTYLFIYKLSNLKESIEILESQFTDLSFEEGKYNVLFVIADDFRPQIGAFIDEGHGDYFSKISIKTPNLDKLASRSMLFKHAYVQFSLCCPSRASLLTSRRPDITRVYGNHNYWRTSGGNFTTLPQHFKEQGYVSLGFGKVFHPGECSNDNDPISWSEEYLKSAFTDGHYLPPAGGAGWASVKAEESDTVPLYDQITTKAAKEALSAAAGKLKTAMDEKLFFIAVGYRKPHLNYICPEEFYQYYPLEKQHGFLVNETWENIEMGKLRVRITDATNSSMLTSDALRHLRRAYFACISFVDSLIGELLDHLKQLGLDDNTIVVFTADHGYHLGENHHFGKMTAHELSNRVPLMIRVPGLTDEGLVYDSLVESLDIFPTVVEASGLENLPECPKQQSDIKLCTQGTSLLPVILDPTRIHKTTAYSQVGSLKWAVYSVRTERYRFIDRATMQRVAIDDDWFRVKPEWYPGREHLELYDLTDDILEQTNIIHQADPQLVDKLQKQLHQFVGVQFEEPKRV